MWIKLMQNWPNRKQKQNFAKYFYVIFQMFCVNKAVLQLTYLILDCIILKGIIM